MRKHVAYISRRQPWQHNAPRRQPGQCNIDMMSTSRPLQLERKLCTTPPTTGPLDAEVAAQFADIILADNTCPRHVHLPRRALGHAVRGYHIANRRVKLQWLGSTLRVGRSSYTGPTRALPQANNVRAGHTTNCTRRVWLCNGCGPYIRRHRAAAWYSLHVHPSHA